jgi:hypothetical protein
MNKAQTSGTMEELQRIKEECSLHYLSLSEEGRRRHSEEVMERAEAAMGRPIEVVNLSKPRHVGEEETAQVWLTYVRF